jgi:hypothetical protein
VFEHQSELNLSFMPNIYKEQAKTAQPTENVCELFTVLNP